MASIETVIWFGIVIGLFFSFTAWGGAGAGVIYVAGALYSHLKGGSNDDGQTKAS